MDTHSQLQRSCAADGKAENAPKEGQPDRLMPSIEFDQMIRGSDAERQLVRQLAKQHGIFGSKPRCTTVGTAVSASNLWR
ncbi:hypothetical protein KIN20_001464 [Parelaphostrongylus tenuis]|uniref:Uncharacterized protein n=1 Tax=Parelaphostrongylus tenuis TaxID=148309 RepID=A0AAD5LYD5_PARTN|nr:hypothetical protein KIN20_001464 [Parelaphostrongylus tenuis]